MQPAAPLPPETSATLPPACPLCGAAGSLPYPAVHERGTLTGSSSDGDNVVVYTALARQAAPPGRVLTRQALCEGTVALILTVYTLWRAWPVLSTSTSLGTVGGLLMVCLVPTPLLGVVLGRTLAKSLGPRKAEEEYEAQLALWKRTRFCPSCQQTWLA